MAVVSILPEADDDAGCYAAGDEATDCDKVMPFSAPTLGAMRTETPPRLSREIV